MASTSQTSSTTNTDLDTLRYLPLFKASIEGDWEEAKDFINTDQGAVRAFLPRVRKTALSIAAISGKTKFMEKLVEKMQPEDLELIDNSGYTALHYTATNGNTEAAKILVRKHPHLTQIRKHGNRTGQSPVLRAASFGHKDLLWYLCDPNVTKDDDPSPFRDEDGAYLLIRTLQADLYDIALHLLRRYPEVATTKVSEGSAIKVLAAKSWTLMSGGGVRFWQRYSNSLLGKLFDNAVGINALKLLGIKNFYDTKTMHGLHRQYLKVVAFICKQIGGLDDYSKMYNLTSTIVLLATEHGNFEVIKAILKIDPYLMWSNNNQNHSMLHVAVKHRQEKVFNYLKELGIKDELACRTNQTSKDNILHLAARLAPIHKLSLISGEALQVQYELQWYKEVEKNVSPASKFEKNEMEQTPQVPSSGKVRKTPRVLFSEEHKELVEKGEKWMKDMASSSMVVATLIATVVFAAAFTVPGGNKNDSGIPVFLNSRSYMVFAVSNALALFSSLTSVLMFLSILTTRYAEEDFLKSLPQKLIIGLTMLFFAIATMTIAFSATYFIMLGHRLAWVSLLIALLTCFPVTLFAFLQFPLLLEMILCTYRSTQ